MDDTTQQEALVAWLKSPENGYIDAKVLPDGSVAALHDLIFTRSIILGVNADTWVSRFCFKDRDLATRRFADLQSEDDVPAGYTAVRGAAAYSIASREPDRADSEGGEHD